MSSHGAAEADNRQKLTHQDGDFRSAHNPQIYS